MELRKELKRKIERKQAEIRQWEEQTRELSARVREGLAYVSGLEETLKLLPKETAAETAMALRPDSALAKAREIILKAGKPLHIAELLKALDRPINHNTRAALSGSLAAYVRKNEVFTRPAPNTFGLVELERLTDEPPADFGAVNGRLGND